MQHELDQAINTVCARLMTWADWQGGIWDATTPQEAARLRLSGVAAYCSAALPAPVVTVLGVPAAQALGYLMTILVGEATFSRTSWRQEVARWGRLVGLARTQKSVLLTLGEYYREVAHGETWTLTHGDQIDALLEEAIKVAGK
jgi:hypothetical protein